MPASHRKEFLDCLFSHPRWRRELEVFAYVKDRLLTAIDEVGFDDFQGEDREVIGRLFTALSPAHSEEALWVQVFLNLWHCNNFGGPHWVELIRRDTANVRYAILAAYWVFAVSSANGGRSLAAMINRCRCWRIAEQHIPRKTSDRLRQWWLHCVLPHRSIG